MWELYLTQTYTCFIAAGCQIIAVCSPAILSDEYLTDEWRPTAGQIETPNCIQLTDNRKKAQQICLVRQPGALETSGLVDFVYPRYMGVYATV